MRSPLKTKYVVTGQAPSPVDRTITSRNEHHSLIKEHRTPDRQTNATETYAHRTTGRQKLKQRKLALTHSIFSLNRYTKLWFYDRALTGTALIEY